jgi:hypothetical protein
MWSKLFYGDYWPELDLAKMRHRWSRGKWRAKWELLLEINSKMFNYCWFLYNSFKIKFHYISLFGTLFCFYIDILKYSAQTLTNSSFKSNERLPLTEKSMYVNSRWLKYRIFDAHTIVISFCSDYITLYVILNFIFF